MSRASLTRSSTVESFVFGEPPTLLPWEVNGLHRKLMGAVHARMKYTRIVDSSFFAVVPSALLVFAFHRCPSRAARALFLFPLPPPTAIAQRDFSREHLRRARSSIFSRILLFYLLFYLLLITGPQKRGAASKFIGLFSDRGNAQERRKRRVLASI